MKDRREVPSWTYASLRACARSHRLVNAHAHTYIYAHSHACTLHIYTLTHTHPHTHLRTHFPTHTHDPHHHPFMSPFSRITAFQRLLPSLLDTVPVAPSSHTVFIFAIEHHHHPFHRPMYYHHYISSPPRHPPYCLQTPSFHLPPEQRSVTAIGHHIRRRHLSLGKSLPSEGSCRSLPTCHDGSEVTLPILCLSLPFAQ